MPDETSYITVNLDLNNPVEIDNFVDFFGSISNQFERYMKSNHPDYAHDARFYVNEVRKGSIIADLAPGGSADIIQAMDNVVVVVEFTALIASVITLYMKGGRKDDASKSELSDYLGTVEALAKDKDGRATIETATFEDGVFNKKVVFTFTTKEAQEAAKNIQTHRDDLEKTDHSDYEKVLMYFKRPDVDDVKVGKRSGERVIIESITKRDLALIYVSKLAEERIKHELRETDGNVFKLGFIVDVNVQTKGGKPAVYNITNFHEVVGLPE